MDRNHAASNRAVRLLAPVLLVALVAGMTGCSRNRAAEAPVVVPATTAPAAASPGATDAAAATPAAPAPAGSGSGSSAADTSAAQTALAKAVKDAESANGTAGKDLAAASSSAEGDPTQ